MLTEECRHYLNIWLHQIEDSTSDQASMRMAAEHVASCTSCQRRLHRLAQAVASSAEDALTCEECQAQLAAYVEAQAAGSPVDTFEGVRRHLALCPYCADAYAQLSELVQASRADVIPVAESYPEFDLSMLRESSGAGDVIQDALDRGRQWVYDAAGGLYVLFGPNVAAQQTPAWATKSTQRGTLLHQVTISDEPAEGWEVDVLAFAEDNDLCRIEVALYRAGATDTELAEIPITLRYGQTSETRATDTGGVVEFAGVPISALDDAIIRVAPRE